MAQAAAAHGTEDGQTTRDRHVWALALGSIGVVFGDIGTSPLYALREAVKASSGGPDAVPGILSIMVWTMLLIVTLKYVLVLPFLARSSTTGGVMIATSNASPPSMRLERPPAVSLSRETLCPVCFSKSAKTATTTARMAPAVSSLMSSRAEMKMR